MEIGIATPILNYNMRALSIISSYMYWIVHTAVVSQYKHYLWTYRWYLTRFIHHCLCSASTLSLYSCLYIYLNLFLLLLNTSLYTSSIYYILYTSILALYSPDVYSVPPSSSSGQRYHKVTTVCVITVGGSENDLASPKSAILSLPWLLYNRLDSLISLCIMYLSCK